MRALIVFLFAVLPGLALPADAQEAIGRVNIAGYNSRGMCTGTLVGPRVVLTAAHCVVRPDGGMANVSDMVFVAGWDGAGHSGASRVDAVEVHPEAVGANGVDVAHDLALLRLADGVEVPAMEVGAAPPSGPFTLAGYTAEVPHRVSSETGCEGAAQGAVWRIGCAIAYGQSGGPVLYGEGAARRVVAVLSARDGDAALAVPVDAWVQRRLARAR